MPRRKRKGATPVRAHQCASCIFRYDGNQVELRPDRLADIQGYLIRGRTHLCHEPDAKGRRDALACRGGRDFQLQIWHRLGLLPEPTDEALRAKMVGLGLWEDHQG
jgi:hypothetical protein